MMHHKPTVAHLTGNDIHMSIRNSVMLCLFFMISSLGCNDTFNQFESKETAISAANEVVIICDDNLWESSVGDSVTYYFEAPYPIMPQPEPIFDIRHFSTEDLVAAPLRRELRTYVILANLNDTESATTKMVLSDLGEEKFRRAKEDPAYFSSVGRDKWANNQLVAYVFGFGADDLASKVVKAFPALAKRINEHDAPLIAAATYLSKESFQIAQQIKEKFGLTIKIPGDYRIALVKENFLWVRQDLDDAISNLAIMRFPYEDESQFQLEGFLSMRDRMGLMVEGASVGSFMQTNGEDLPVYLYKKELDGHYAVEGRGIWELTEDFLGGPFVTYAILDSAEIIMIDAFVHAPGKDKRDFVQRLEHIVSSLKF